MINVVVVVFFFFLVYYIANISIGYDSVFQFVQFVFGNSFYC